jgi:hypothetical protein
MPVGRSEDRAMQGCNPGAESEAGAGGAWKHALPLSRFMMESEGDGMSNLRNEIGNLSAGGKI